MSNQCPAAKRIAADEKTRRDVAERASTFRKLVEVASAAEVRAWLHSLAAMSDDLATEIARELLAARRPR